MAGDADSSPEFSDIGGDYSEDNGEVSLVKEETSENENESRQTPNGKPPRHLSVVRHSMITATIVSPADLVVNTYFCDLMQCNNYFIMWFCVTYEENGFLV